MPNEKLTIDYNDPEAIPGVICKVASVSPLEVTEADLKKINKYTLSPVSAEDVFIFKATIADNEQDDRNFMPFNLKALQDLKKLYPGKTMLKDHARRADNQIARIYDTELVQDANKPSIRHIFHKGQVTLLVFTHAMHDLNHTAYSSIRLCPKHGKLQIVHSGTQSKRKLLHHTTS